MSIDRSVKLDQDSKEGHDIDDTRTMSIVPEPTWTDAEEKAAVRK